MTITVTSPGFAADARIPAKYTGDGDDLSPPLAWSGLPEATKQLALVCDDPDAPSKEPWVHWVLYGIAGDVTELPEGLAGEATLRAPVAARQGRNSWTSGRNTGYRGPAPPKGHGVHHYRFTLYALDAELDLQPELEKSELLAKIKDHVLAQGRLVGTYERK